MEIKTILGSTKLFTQNSKIKKTSKEFGVRLFNFGIPAYKTKDGKLTCPFADTCVKFCYARKGSYIWSNVAQAFEKRYKATQHADFVTYVCSELQRIKADFIRIHDSGDFYSRKYLAKWVSIAKLNPNVKFYAYTNSYDLVREIEVPENMDFTFSTGSKLRHTLQDGEKHTQIFNTKEDLKEANYIDSSKFDLLSTKWFTNSKNIGLIFH